MKIFGILLTTLFYLIVLTDGALSQDANRTWISDVTIISPENLGHVGTGSVLVENGRIVRIERKALAKPPAGATVVWAKGQYLIPGLIDSHVHVASVPGMSY